VLDVVPDKGVHVYAPGAAGYRPIALTVQPQANLVGLPTGPAIRAAL
jgi:hypothetical protein